MLKTGYSLQLTHGLMGYFPVTVGDTERIVVTTDIKLIEDVWKTLPPRRSEISTCNFYVNEEIGIGFAVRGSTRSDNEQSEPFLLLGRAEFDALIAKDPHPFRWAPGLISNDMGHDEFIRTIELAIKDEQYC